MKVEKLAILIVTYRDAKNSTIEYKGGEHGE